MSSNNSPSLELHEFEPASPDSSRSPCPALNSLCGHGYLPRSGRNISFMQLINAIRQVYNTSLPLTLFLASAGFLTCGHNGFSIPFLGTIDLHDLARHGRIEHDTSLAHADAAPGAVFAPSAPDATLLTELLNEANGRGTLNLDDFAKIRSRREKVLAIEGKKLSFAHAEITRGEVALILSIIGDGEKVSTERLRQWMGEDRLPDAWQRPERTQGLIETVMMARKVGAAVNSEKARGAEVRETHKNK